MFSRFTRTQDALLASTFSLLLAGCPIAREVEDGGLDAARAEDAAQLDASAVDAVRGADAPPTSDAPPDAYQVDARLCACDDGVACTRDSCDPTGACVHESDCPANEYCALSPAPGCVPSPTCTSSYFCEDMPCQPTTGCRRGFCQYAWGPDQDGDGNPSVDCGGTDCWPVDPGRPGAESCNGQDDDCDTRFDEDSPVSSDVAHCGRCFSSCGAADMCVDGECRCSGTGQVACINPGATAYACFDGLADPLHCGSCIPCPDGSTCEAGLCRYRATWMHGVDVPTRVYDNRLIVAPNGDVLFEVSGRPTQLLHEGRAAESIPDGASPFARHIVRLDRDGNLVGVTSLPMLYPSLARYPRALDDVGVTNEGFYFCGHVPEDMEVLGVRFTRVGNPLLGYVPRATGAIAWVRPIAVTDIFSLAGTREGTLALLGLVAPSLYNPSIRRFGPDGAALPHDTRFGEFFLAGATSVFASSAGGFIVLARPWRGELATIPSTGEAHGASAALIYGTSGLVQEAIWMNSLSSGQIFAERPDASAWLVRPVGYDEYGRTIHRSFGSSSSFGPFAAFDESGVATVRDFDPTREVERYRDMRIAETVALPGVAYLDEGRAWLLNTTSAPGPTRSFLLPGATTTLSRVDLPPIP